MADYVMGRVTLKKLRDICNAHGFSKFTFRGKVIDLSWNLHDKQHQIKVVTPGAGGTSNPKYKEWWPDDFRDRLAELPDHVAVRVESSWEVPRLILIRQFTAAMKAAALEERRAKRR